MAIKQFVSIGGVGTDDIEVHVEPSSMGKIVQINGVPLTEAKWNQLKDEVDKLVEETS